MYLHYKLGRGAVVCPARTAGKMTTTKTAAAGQHRAQPRRKEGAASTATTILTKDNQYHNSTERHSVRTNNDNNYELATKNKG
jgi:hypothetical protein